MFQQGSEKRFSVYYAALFGSIGAISPFFALWLDHGGISASMIGLIVATPSVAMLFTTIALGRWADRLRDRRTAVVVANWVIFFAHVPLIFSTSPWLLLALWCVSGIAMHAMVPATDAAALSLTARQGSDFARIRVYGSIGFIAALTLAGMLYERQGIAMFIVLLVLGNLSRLVFAYRLPVIPTAQSAQSMNPASVSSATPATPATSATSVALAANLAGEDKQAPPVSLKTESYRAGRGGDAPPDSDQRDPLYRPAIVLTLIGAALINASHAVFNTFGILLWTQQGLSETVSSLAVSAGVVAEVILMWRFKSLTQDISARALLIFAALCGVVRWSVLAIEPSLPLLIAVQLLHGVTFGMMYLAGASFISRRVPESDAARGQAMLATLTTACMASAMFISGVLFDQWGGALYWGMTLCCCSALLVLVGSYRFMLPAEASPIV